MYSVHLLCRFYKVSRSGYYTWKKRPLGLQNRRRAALTGQIKNVFDESKGRYGSPRVHRALIKQGTPCCVNTVAKIMRIHGLKGRISRVYWRNPKNHAFFKKTDNLRINKAEPQKINQVWAGDITFTKINKEWQYLAAVMDVYSRRIVGWALGGHRTVELTERALKNAISSRKPARGLLFHSDRGIEYASYRYQSTLKKHGIVPSMNRPGQCGDNAHMESFFHSLKGELLRGVKIINADHLKGMIKEYLSNFYNTKRLHSGPGYRSPEEFESVMSQ